MKILVRLIPSNNCFINLPSRIINHVMKNLKNFGSDRILFKLKWDNGEVILAWSGGQSKSSEYLEISKEFATHAQLSDGMEVEISSVKLNTIDEAISVSVEPSSSDDWEILELNAEYLEQQLINQIAVLRNNMTIPLWINSSTFINIHIVQINPNKKFVKLVSGTEVFVTPKPREQVIPPNSQDLAKEKSLSNYVKRKKKIFRLQETTPCEISHLLAHRSDMYKLNWYDGMLVEVIPIHLEPQKKEKQSKVYLRVYSNSLARVGHIILHKSIIKKLDSFVYSRVKVYPRVHLESNIEQLLNQTANEKEDSDKIDQNVNTLKEENTNESKEDEYMDYKEDKDEVSILTLDHMGGMDNEIKSCIDHIITIFSRIAFKKHIGSYSKGTIHIFGPQGSGKTLLSCGVANYFMSNVYFKAYPMYINCSNFLNQDMNTIKSKLSYYFSKAMLCQPCVLIFDDLDLLLPSEKDGQQQAWQFTVQLNVILNTFLSWFRTLKSEEHDIAIIMTSLSEDSLNNQITNHFYTSLRIKIKTPNHNERIKIIEKILNKKGIKYRNIDRQNGEIKKSSKALLDISEISLKCEGFQCGDIERVIDRAIHIASLDVLDNRVQENHIEYNNNNNNVLEYTNSGDESDSSMSLLSNEFNIYLDMNHISEALKDFIPSSLVGIKLQKSEVQWDDIGGLEDVKTILKQTLEWPSKYSFLFKSIPIRHRSGILLYGPPGCGKTMLACAVAKECNLNFLSVKGPELLNKYIGQSEESVRDMFSRAQMSAPCVLFFDEFDAIAPKRGHDNTGVTDRVVNQFLTQLDGIETLEGVYVLAATSRPDLIDPALLRPGRLDKSIYVGIPNELERYSIIKTLSRKLDLDENVNLKSLSMATEAFTGADLQALFYNCQVEAIHKQIDSLRLENQAQDNIDVKNTFHLISMKNKDEENIKMYTADEKMLLSNRLETLKQNFIYSDTDIEVEEVYQERKGPVITSDIIDTCLSKFRPSLSKSERKRYESIYSNFLQSRGSDFSDIKEILSNQKATLA